MRIDTLYQVGIGCCAMYGIGIGIGSMVDANALSPIIGGTFGLGVGLVWPVAIPFIVYRSHQILKGNTNIYWDHSAKEWNSYGDRHFKIRKEKTVYESHRQSHLTKYLTVPVMSIIPT